MVEPSMTATFEGKPLSVLSDLIQKRQKWLGETYKEAVAATAINALNSIRAITSTYFGKNTVNVGKDDVAIVQRNDVHPSFTGSSHTPCFRKGGTPSRHAPRVELGRRTVRLVPRSSKDWLNAQVWDVKLSRKRKERWAKFPESFVAVATSYDMVLAHVKRKFASIAKRQAGLAKNVLGSLMGMLSTRKPASDKAGEHVAKIVKRYGVVQRNDSGNTYSVHIESNLLYALDAVMGGSTGVQNALKSAANRTAGIIRHKAGSKLTEELKTPFPEVKKR